MRERVKRRKKGDDSPPKEQANAPVPLQPKYFESEPHAPEPEAPPARPQPELEPEPLQPPVASSLEARTEARPSRRRRRGRGGRGTGTRRQAGEAPARPATPEPAVPEPEVAAPVSEVRPAPAPASKGTVVLAIGLPGSGKSSWFKRHNIRPLSSDLLRELLFDDSQEQRFQDLVFSNLRSMLKARLVARRPMNYVDATNLTPHDRHSWIKLAKDYGYDVQGVFFDVPVELCLERNQRRERVVSEDVMRKMAAKLKAPTFEEGFSKITVVRVKKTGGSPGEA
ncbi:MAG: AAA family ATPase [Acidobacteriales bacterium]|nr:AAA family ATPase [Candidatus Koribacter versatilis]MBI3645139.1 AAA family ATPase [Terriglobales bacterium]